MTGTATRCFLLLLLLSACSRQKEGQRCDMNNFDEDCNTGLTCVPLEGSAIRNAAVCCPADNPTAAACLGTSLDLVDDASVPPPPESADASDE